MGTVNRADLANETGAPEQEEFTMEKRVSPPRRQGARGCCDAGAGYAVFYRITGVTECGGSDSDLLSQRNETGMAGANH